MVVVPIGSLKEEIYGDTNAKFNIFSTSREKYPDHYIKETSHYRNQTTILADFNKKYKAGYK